MAHNQEYELIRLAESSSSNGITARKEAIEKLSGLLDSDAVRDIVSHKTSTNFDVQDFLDHILLGLGKHVEKCARAGKSDKQLDTFIICLSKIMSIISEHPLLVDSIFIMEMILRSLEDENYLKFCGNQFIRILVEYVTKNNLTLCKIKLEHWKDLLSILVDLYFDNSSILKVCILDGIGKILQESLRNSQILVHLPPFVAKFEEIFLAEDEELTRRQALCIEYAICEALSIQNSHLIASHSRKILQRIIDNHRKTLHNENRELTFKFFHLILILNSIPENVEMPNDDSSLIWNNLKLKMFNILDNELKQLPKQSDNRKRFVLSPYLVKCSAYIFIDLVRTKFISQSTKGTDEQARKRARYNETFSEILEMVRISSKDFDLGWFCVLCEVVEMQELTLTHEDLVEVLKILMDIQLTLQVEVLMQYFCRCCKIVFIALGTEHRDSFLTIGQRFLNTSPLDPHCAEFLIILINSGIFPLKNRVQIAKDFQEKKELEVLIAALMEPNTKEVFLDQNVGFVKWIAASKEIQQFPPHLVAQLILVYVINSNQVDRGYVDVEMQTKIQVRKYNETIKNIEKELKYKYLYKFIKRTAESSDLLPKQDEISIKNLSEITNNLIILPEVIPTDSAALYFIKRAEVCVLVHNRLKKVPKIDEFLQKIQCETVRCVKEVEKYLTQKKRQLSRNHIPTVCERLSHLFREDIHGLAKDCEIVGIVKWIYENFQIFSQPHHLQGQNEANYCICITNCIQCLVYMHRFHADVANGAFVRIADEFLDKDTKISIRIQFDVLRTIVRGAYSDPLAEWACGQIEDFMQRFNKSQEIIEEVLELHQHAAVYFNGGNSELLQRILEKFTLFTGYALRNAYRHEMSNIFIGLIISHFQNNIAEDEDTFETFIEILKRFLAVPIYTVQLAVVQAFVEIFGSTKQIDFSTFPKDDVLAFFNAQPNGDKDLSQNKLSLIVQLCQGLVVNCMSARRFMLFEFTQFLSRQTVDEGILQRLHDPQFNENAEIFSKYVEYCMPYLIELWARNGRAIDSFPSTIASSTQANFLDKYRRIFPRILIYNGQEKSLKQIGDISGSQLKELIKKSLPDCLPFVLSAHDDSCRFMKDFFIKNFGSLDDVMKRKASLILLKLFENFWDAKEYEEIFGFQCKEIRSDFLLNSQQFESCHKKLSEITNSEEDLFNDLGFSEPFEMVRIAMKLKENIYLAPDMDEMLNPILKFIHFTRKVVTMLQNGAHDGTMKNFFFCDISRFLLILISKMPFPKNVNVALLREFNTFLEASFEFVENSVKEQLEFIVDKLTTIVSNSTEENVKKIALKSLTFLFVNKQQCLSSALKVINNMPNNMEFDAIRRTQDVIVNENFSYASQLITEDDMDDECGLIRDIEHFLAIKNPNIDSIRYLKKQLSKNPDKLVAIYGNAERGKAILQKLTNIFIKQVLSEDDSLRLEATKCLSEMAYLEFDYANVMHPNEDDNQSKQTINYNEECPIVYKKIALSLLQLQQDCDVFVSNTAATLLNSIFSDAIGRGMEIGKKRIFMSTKTLPQVLNINVETVKHHRLKNLFNVLTGDTHEMWIVRVTGDILKAFGNTSLQEIARKKINFAEALVPTLVSLLLSIHYQLINGEIQQSVNDFFAKYAEAKANGIPSIHLNKKSIQIMLTICDCIRYYNAVSHRDMANGGIFSRIELNNLQIADAAAFSEFYTNALIYTEMWITDQMYGHKKTSQDILGTTAREIMIKCYEAIEEKDAAKPLYDMEEMRMWYLNNESSIGRHMVERDMANVLKREEPCQFEQLLQRLGLHYLTNCLSSEQNFDCAWRMSDWSVLDDSPCDENINFEHNHYKALKNIHKGDENLTYLFSEKSRLNIIDSMRQKNPQSTKIFHNHFAMLQQVQQVEDFCVAIFGENRENATKKLFEKWHLHDTLPCGSFVEKEKIQAQRIALLTTSDSVEMVREKHKTLMNLVTEAQKANFDNIAIKYLYYLRGLSLDDEMESKFLLEDAQICMSSGYIDLAKKLFTSLIQNPKYGTFLTRITGLWTCGAFFAENMTENPNVIYHDYFKRAKDDLVKLYRLYPNSSAIRDEQVKIHKSLARFADKIYMEREKYLNSNEYKEKCHWMDVTQKEVEKLVAQKPPSEEMMRQNYVKRIVLMKNRNLDEQEIKQSRTDRNFYLTLAVEYYASLAAFDENSNISISRLVSLWFSNPTNEDITCLLKNALKDVPSYKFLKVVPQLASRLGHSDPTFIRLLSQLLVRCCAEHPYHCLNHILALQNASYDSPDKTEEESGKMLQLNARAILKILQKNQEIKSILRELYDVSTVLIDLANKPCGKGSNNEVKLNPNEKIFTIGMKQLYHLPTVDLPIRRDCQYTNITYVTSWAKEYSLLGGINAPKHLKCRCSDGQERSIILKGNDDLHQDALMQQVFLYINDIFRTEPQLQKLEIRTYKIIPLTKRSGFMEFCANSTPLSQYLQNAHNRYRPHEVSFSEGRKIISDYATYDPAEKLKKFLALCDKIRPVFHNYFIEQFSNPREWYDKRLTYINSVASTSMVGYVLGIGDRHLSNILLDQKTAQIIHIDFGISFERGLIQKTPELVPFRLTRDIVAAMGFLATDGVFRRSCEVTMEMLRKNQATINTILEVLLYDPLCNWSTSIQPENDVSPNESNQMSEQKNASAARALFRVNEKLSGRDSNTTVHSVSTQVERLIQQAINPANLSRMFHGWSAFY